MPKMKFGAGLSVHPDTVRGAQEAARAALADGGLTRGGWALCFFTMAHLPRADALRETLLHELGCEALTGCSAHGLVVGEAEVEGRPIRLWAVDSGRFSATRSTRIRGGGTRGRVTNSTPGTGPLCGVRRANLEPSRRGRPLSAGSQ